MVNGEVVDEVEHFTYLGAKVTTSTDGEEEILLQISKASQDFASLQGTWRSKNITQKTKIWFLKNNVLSTLLHGAESWKMTKKKNRNRTNHTASPAKEWKWIGYVLRMPPAALPHKLPSGGHLMAVVKELDQKKHGGGQWRKS